MSAFNLPNGTPISSLPNANGIPYLTVHDDQNKHTVPSGQYWKKETSVGSGFYIWVPTSEVDKLPVKVTELEDKIDDLNMKIDNIINGSTPATTQLTGSIAELASAQDTQIATTVQAYNRAAGAVEIGVYVESGAVRVRTDGDPATATTGIPMGGGYFEFWAAAALSVYFVSDSTITVVSK